MIKHTPGPWLLNKNNNWKTNPFSVTVRKPGVHSTTVANIPTRMTISPAEQQANAHLIAAAPEMLAALQGFQNAWIANRLVTSDEAALILAAIAKANGGQS